MAHPVGEPSDRRRSVYLGGWRIDIARRAGVARVIPDAALARVVARGLEAAGAPAPGSVAVVLTDDGELADLNITHLGKAGPTDVLSFPMLPPESFPAHPGRPRPERASGPRGGAEVVAQPWPAALGPFHGVPGARTHVGDIAISVERGVEQALEGRGGQTGDVRWSPADEIRLLALHGTLHLCGWDHGEAAEEASMRALEQRILAEERG